MTLALGGMTVDEMLARMSSKEFTRWQIFYGFEPFGFEADFLGHGTVAAAIYNVNRKKGAKSVKPEDFIPKRKNKEQQTADEMVGIAEMLNAAHGGEDLRK